MTTGFRFTFPAIRGVQAGREYYVCMVPLRLIPRIFQNEEQVMPPERRAQRLLNKGRIPEMARYVSRNPDSYIFSALTASIDADVEFDALGNRGEERLVGRLHIPMEADFLINDGQHRRAAIQRALREKPELGDESIAVVFFLDIGLKRSQQMFCDLNKYAIRPTPSLSVLYDHRDQLAILTRMLVWKSDAFRDLVEMERSSLPVRSQKLFTLSGVYLANRDLLSGHKQFSLEEQADLAVHYWDQVARQFPAWEAVRSGELEAAQLRREYLHTHGVTLQAFGRIGASLLQLEEQEWPAQLAPLGKLDWRRSNSALWEGRAMLGGRVSKTERNVTLTSNLLKWHLGISLRPDEEIAEELHLQGALV